jgi:hypothetical protein
MLDPAVTIVKLEPALELFHAACGGDMDDVVSLFEVIYLQDVFVLVQAALGCL